MKLADALLRRKELQDKVNQLHRIKDNDLVEFAFERKKISDDLDDIKARVPKVTAAQITQEYDRYASKLRRIDAAIQQTNWTTDVNVADDVWENEEVSQ